MNQRHNERLPNIPSMVTIKGKAIVLALAPALGCFVIGAVLIALLYQLPAQHSVDIGGYDAAYVRGFYDPQYHDTTSNTEPYLVGSDGQARWSRGQSYLIFPQVGLPATITLRLRGWREPGMPFPTVQWWLNGRTRVGSIQTDGTWQEYHLAITSGQGKPDDVVLELRSDTTTLTGDDRAVGVLLDRVIYTVSPTTTTWQGQMEMIIPYPWQLVYGGSAMLWLWFLLRPHTPPRYLWAALATGAVLMGVLFLCWYRWQPPYPYPLRWFLPMLNMALLGVLLLRDIPVFLQRWHWLPSIAVVAGGVGWCLLIWTNAQDHVTLSIPGVEKDFRVFATRATSLERVFQADGFYNLGYPLLLWLTHPFTHGNVFLAAQVVAAASGGILLWSGYWLTFTLLPNDCNKRLWASLVVIILACSPMVVAYALYVGSDMPFAALVALSLALFTQSNQQDVPLRKQLAGLALAGAAAGGAFLMRHLGMVLLVWGGIALVVVVVLTHTLPANLPRRMMIERVGKQLLWRIMPFVAGFVLIALPQFVVNTQHTGNPLSSQQAKNIWLAVYGDTDWGRWREVPDSIPLREVVLRDPPRFLANWWGNIRAFVGSGAEDTSEFGRALHLRLLGFPANWLAIVGLCGWFMTLWRSMANPVRHAAHQTASFANLLLYIAAYVALVSFAFVLQRFFLPLVVVYAAAAVWLLQQSIGAIRQTPPQNTTSNDTPIRQEIRGVLAVGLVLVILLSSGFTIGTRVVLDNQPTDEVAIVQQTLALLLPNDRVIVHVSPNVPLAKYSVLAHQMLPWQEAHDPTVALAWAREQRATYVLWDTTLAPTPSLPDGTTTLVGQAGRYALYHLK